MSAFCGSAGAHNAGGRPVGVNAGLGHCRMSRANLDAWVMEGFGDEWRRFDQSALNTEERDAIARDYFAIFPWDRLEPGAVGVDLGCGSGRWACVVAPRVGHLHCVDASAEALAVAAANLRDVANVSLHHSSVDSIPLPEGSLDFAYSLLRAVLHHVPRTAEGLATLSRKLKPGAPLLLYLYYALDNRPTWFRMLWHLSEVPRAVISRLPHGLRYAASQAIAVTVLYWPLARTALVLERLGVPVDTLPLSAYRHRSFYVMRTDALDRFGTRLEQRFTRAEILCLMTAAGLEDVTSPEVAPYWCASRVPRQSNWVAAVSYLPHLAATDTAFGSLSASARESLH